MGKQYDINIALRGKDEGAGKTVDTVAGKLKMMRKEQTESGERGLERLLKRGPEGWADMIGGGLAVAGIDMAAKALGKVGDAVQEVRRQFVEGKMDAGDMVDKIAGGIPVLGEVWKAGRSLREAFTGEKLELELVNVEAKLTALYFDQTLKTAQTTRGVLRDIARETEASRTKQRIAETQDQLGKRIIGLRAEQEEGWKGDRAKIEDDKAKVRAEYEKQAKAKQDQVDNLRAQFRNKYGAEPDRANLTLQGGQIEAHVEDAAAEINQIELQQGAVNRIRNEGAKKQADIEREGAAMILQHNDTFNAQIREAQDNAGKEITKNTLDETARRMEEVHKLENEAADELGRDREKWAAEQTRAEADAAKDEGRAAERMERMGRLAGGTPERQEPFHADLLNSRYHGLAGEARESNRTAAAAEKTATLLAELVGLVKKNGQRDGHGVPDGIVLRP